MCMICHNYAKSVLNCYDITTPSTATAVPLPRGGRLDQRILFSSFSLPRKSDDARNEYKRAEKLFKQSAVEYVAERRAEK